MRTVRLGIIGSGFGAKVHLPVFSSIPGVDVVAISASSKTRGGMQAASRIGSPTKFYDWREMLDTQGLDAVCVAAPPEFHAEIVCAALAVGKHVLCEKPFGRNVDDATQMLNAAQKNGLVHAVDYQFRMEPGIAALKHQVETGVIGKIIRIDVTWLTGGRSDPATPWAWQHDSRLGGGVLDGFGSHVIDYIEWITQREVVKVFAQSRILIENRNDTYGLAHRVTAEDDCDILCNLVDGVVANLTFSNCYPIGTGHRIEIFGKRGRLFYSSTQPFMPEDTKLTVETDSHRLRTIEFEGLHPIANVDSRVLAVREVARRFVEAINGFSTRDFPNFFHGLRVRQILNSARESMKYQSIKEVQSV